MTLYAARYTNSDTSAALLERFSNIQDAGVRWALDSFGVVRMEVTIAARGQYDAYDRYKNHHGQRLAFYGSDLYQPVSGNITAVEWLEGNLIRYIASGPVNRLNDRPNTTQYAATTTIRNALISVLGSYCLIDDGTTTSIASNTQTIEGWNPQHPQGDYPAESIADLLAMSDSTNRVYDFWLVDQPFSGTALRQFTPHYQPRSDSAGPDWIITRADIAPGGLSLSRDINDFATTANVWYGLIASTATSGSDTTIGDTAVNFISGGVKPGDSVTNITKTASAKVVTVTATLLTIDGGTFLRGTATGGSTTTLIDTTQNFVTAGVVVGDALYNDPDDSRGVVTSISTTTSTNDTLNMSGGMTGGKTNQAGERYRVAHQFASGDAYTIRTAAQTKFKTASTASTPFWSRTSSVFESAMGATAAGKYATILADTAAKQRQYVVIGAPFIRDSSGAKHRLFDVVASGGGYLQISDLFPAAALSTTSRDRLTTFRITSMDYDYTANTLRCGLDTLDTRLDARLRRAKILNSEMVARG